MNAYYEGKLHLTCIYYTQQGLDDYTKQLWYRNTRVKSIDTYSDFLTNAVPEFLIIIENDEVHKSKDGTAIYHFLNVNKFTSVICID